MNNDNINIVMVGTTHPGNIGAAARAMKNMCISRLVLVAPECPVGEVAFARASGAHSILDQSKTVDSLQQAIADCQLVIGATARQRSLPWPELSPDQMAEKIWSQDEDTNVALVFGREHSGLTNDELMLCNYMVCIPTNPDFSSLNVAAAIQVLCYEVYKQRSLKPPTRTSESREPPATSGEIEGYFDHLQQVLERTQFLDVGNPGLLMQRLRRLYQRVELSKNEVNILRGTLSAVEKYKAGR